MAWKHALLLATPILIIGCGSDAPEAVGDPGPAVQADRLTDTAPSPPLVFTIKSIEDISYPGTMRMVARVVVDANSIPAIEQLRSVSMAVWAENGKRIDEFTVFIYLPEMNHNSVAYAIGEFSPEGVRSFKINEASLFDHPWYGETETAKRQAETRAEFEQVVAVAGKHDYSISIAAEPPVGNNMAVRITTDFPDQTVMNVSIGRQHWLQGSTDTYSGELYQSYSAVKDGEITFVASLDDSKWINEHKELVSADVGFGPITRISDEIEISILYTPMVNQPESVVSVLGKRGEHASGDGADNSFGSLVTYRVEKKLVFPVVN